MRHEVLPVLPALCGAMAEAAQGSGGSRAAPPKILIAGSNGFKGDAAVAAIAVRMRLTACSCHQALTHLLHQNAALLVTPPPQSLSPTSLALYLLALTKTGYSA